MGIKRGQLINTILNINPGRTDSRFNTVTSLLEDESVVDELKINPPLNPSDVDSLTKVCFVRNDQTTVERLWSRHIPLVLSVIGTHIYGDSPM